MRNQDGSFMGKYYVKQKKKLSFVFLAKEQNM